MNKPVNITKSVLWAIIGVWAVITVVRFMHGLGATTGLGDGTPWGIWIAFDVMAGVALAAGGFVLAGTVYIFGIERYRPFVRPAVLTAFLGYIAVAIGLMYDLGLPWNIWHPIIFPQHHSVLFEVAMCVMCYLTVLALEFAPVVLEHSWFNRPTFRAIHKFLKTVTIPLVIAGIVLSTLHQSSLGSLFLIQPFRVDPLWYSPIVYVLFFVSAIGLGLMMVTAESLLSGWFFGHKVRTDLLSGLGIAASVVLFIYLALRVGDLAIRGVLPHAFDGSWQGNLFLFELSMSALIPAILLAIPKVRHSIAGLRTCATLTVFGMIGYRFDICIVTFTRPDGMPYVPTWMELAISAGVVAGGVLTFIFFVEHLRVYEPEPHPEPLIPPSNDVVGAPDAFPPVVNATRRYSAIVVVAAAATLGVLPASAVFGPQAPSNPVWPVRMVDARITQSQDSPARKFELTSFDPSATPTTEAADDDVKIMLINGNRDDRFVPFDHAFHVKEYGGEEACGICHHENLPFDTATACSRCHRDMYEKTDIFNHASHVDELGGNNACIECHAADEANKSRATAKACGECHTEMLVADSRIPEPEHGLTGIAPSYTDAMHGLCIKCHEEVAIARDLSNHARCDTCHRPEIKPIAPADLVLLRTASTAGAHSSSELPKPKPDPGTAP